MVVLMILTGLAAGIIGGMGMGGGTLLIPALNIFFNVNQHTAQAVNLVAFIPMSIIALIIHLKNKLVNFKKSLILILPGMASALGGAFLAKSTSSELLQKFYGIFLILLALFQLIVFIVEKHKKNKV